MGIMLPTLDRDEPPLLEARKLTKVYSGGGLSRRKRKTVALEDFSLAIGGDRPVFIGVAGESGSGKTTLVRLLLGFIKPTSGEVLYKGNNIWDMSRAARQTFRHEVQAIFQDPYEVYNPFYKVDHVLATPISKFHLARNKIEARQLVAEALETVGLRPDEILGRYPHQLSGGQRQRIMVARALLIGSRIIIADEPVSMVDASLRATIMESILNLHREFGISVIYVTHDLTTAYQICQSIIVLYRGSGAEMGDVERVIKDPQHPYTRLLMGSIPVPDPDRRWTRNSTVAATEEDTLEESGCKFASRCPFVMDMCRQAAPPLFLADGNRAVTCFLYRDSEVLPSEQMGRVLAAPQSSHHS